MVRLEEMAYLDPMPETMLITRNKSGVSIVPWHHKALQELVGRKDPADRQDSRDWMVDLEK